MANGELATRVVAHFRAQQRDLPWRHTQNAYAIWVSEIMLQQTRVATVIPYYERWLERFPSVRALADADLDDVLSCWAGLGYYSRARNLHRGAREVVATYGGVVPKDLAELNKLPGVGRYTAGAIASIAYGRRAAVVDGNVARVLARVFAIEDDVKSTAGLKQLWKLAESLVPADAPGDFNQGLMELGATVCTPTSPRCDECPLSERCIARATDRIEELPVMPPRRRSAQLPRLDSIAAWIERAGEVLLAQREPKGLYGGLWELPQDESAARLGEAIAPGIRLTSKRAVAVHRQVLSHRRMQIRVFTAELTGRLGKPRKRGYTKVGWHRLDHVGQLGISSATRAIVDRYMEYRGWKRTKKR